MFSQKKKALVAAAAGAAILAASGATFALWHDESTLSDADTRTGYLRLDTTSGDAEQFGWFIQDGVWINNVGLTNSAFDSTNFNPANFPGSAVDLDGFILVPGDFIQVTFADAVEAAGTNMDWRVQLINGIHTDDLAIWGLFVDIAVAEGSHDGASDLVVTFDWARSFWDIRPDAAARYSNAGWHFTTQGANDGQDRQLTFGDESYIQVIQNRDPRYFSGSEFGDTFTYWVDGNARTAPRNAEIPNAIRTIDGLIGSDALELHESIPAAYRAAIVAYHRTGELPEGFAGRWIRALYHGTESADGVASWLRYASPAAIEAWLVEATNG